MGTLQPPSRGPREGGTGRILERALAGSGRAHVVVAVAVGVALVVREAASRSRPVAGYRTATPTRGRGAAAAARTGRTVERPRARSGAIPLLAGAGGIDCAGGGAVAGSRAAIPAVGYGSRLGGDARALGNLLGFRRDSGFRRGREDRGPGGLQGGTRRRG